MSEEHRCVVPCPLMPLPCRCNNFVPAEMGGEGEWKRRSLPTSPPELNHCQPKQNRGKFRQEAVKSRERRGLQAAG